MENITGYLYDFAALHPEKPALLHPVRMTFEELCRLTDAYAAGFIRSGISKGCRTVVLIKPGADLFAVVFALLRIGAIPVLIDPGMGIRAMTRALSTVKAGAFAGMAKAHLLRLLFPRAFQTIRVAVSTGMPLFRGDYSLKKSGSQEVILIRCLIPPRMMRRLFFLPAAVPDRQRRWCTERQWWKHRFNTFGTTSGILPVI